MTKTDQLDIVKILKEKGIDLKVVGSRMVLRSSKKTKEIEMSDMQNLLLDSILNWFKYS